MEWTSREIEGYLSNLCAKTDRFLPSGRWKCLWQRTRYGNRREPTHAIDIVHHQLGGGCNIFGTPFREAVRDMLGLWACFITAWVVLGAVYPTLSLCIRAAIVAPLHCKPIFDLSLSGAKSRPQLCQAYFESLVASCGLLISLLGWHCLLERSLSC